MRHQNFPSTFRTSVRRQPFSSVIIRRVTEMRVAWVHVLGVRGRWSVAPRLWRCRWTPLMVCCRRMVHELIHKAVSCSCGVVQHVMVVLTVRLHEVIRCYWWSRRCSVTSAWRSGHVTSAIIATRIDHTGSMGRRGWCWTTWRLVRSRISVITRRNQGCCISCRLLCCRTAWRLLWRGTASARAAALVRDRNLIWRRCRRTCWRLQAIGELLKFCQTSCCSCRSIALRWRCWLMVIRHLAVETALLRGHCSVVANVRRGVLLLCRRWDRNTRCQAHARRGESRRKHSGPCLKIGGRKLPIEVASSLLGHAHSSCHIHWTVVLPQVSLQLLELVHLICCCGLLVLVLDRMGCRATSWLAHLAAEEWALADSVEAREQAYKDCEQPVK